MESNGFVSLVPRAQALLESDSGRRAYEIFGMPLDDAATKVTYGSDAVAVAFTTEPAAGGQTCPSNSPTR